MPTTVASKRTAFAQKGKKGKNDKKTGEDKKTKEEKGEPKKNFLVDRTCYICGKKGDSAKTCPNKAKANDDSSISSKSAKKSLDKPD